MLKTSTMYQHDMANRVRNLEQTLNGCQVSRGDGELWIFIPRTVIKKSLAACNDFATAIDLKLQVAKNKCEIPVSVGMPIMSATMNGLVKG